jgi:hypothetical protein
MTGCGTPIAPLQNCAHYVRRIDLPCGHTPQPLGVSHSCDTLGNRCATAQAPIRWRGDL